MNELIKALLSIYILHWVVALTGIWIYVISVGGWPFRDPFLNWFNVLSAFLPYHAMTAYPMYECWD